LSQLHLRQVLDQVLEQLRIAAGENELHDVTADLGGQHVPMKPGHWREVIKAYEGMTRQRDRRRVARHGVISLEIVAGKLDELQRIAGPGRAEEQVGGGNHHAAAYAALDHIARLELRQYVGAGVRWGRSVVLLDPVLG